MLDYTIYMMRVELINDFLVHGWRFFIFLYSLFSYIVDSTKCPKNIYKDLTFGPQ